jgi:predicted dehydrogenase
VRTYSTPDEVSPDGYDAIVLFESRPHDERLVAGWLDAGKHVLLAAPTPLAPALGRSDRARLALINPDRFLPSRRLIRQQVDAGKLGEPGFVRSHRWSGALDDPFAAVERDLDVAIWLIGRAPDVVYGVAGDGSCQLHLGFPGGPMALIDVATTLPPGDGYRSLSLIGSCGAAYADDHQNVQVLFRGGPARAVPVPEAGRQQAAAVQDLLLAIREQRDLAGTAAEWLRVVAVAEAARRSAASGRAVALEGS